MPYRNGRLGRAVIAAKPIAKREGPSLMIAKSTELAVPAEAQGDRKQAAEHFSADELFALARNKSVEGRRTLFATVCDLFMGERQTLSGRHRGDFLQRRSFIVRATLVSGRPLSHGLLRSVAAQLLEQGRCSCRNLRVGIAGQELADPDLLKGPQAKNALCGHEPYVAIDTAFSEQIEEWSTRASFHIPQSRV